MADDVERRWVAGLRATAHPVRLQILSLLTGQAMSAAEVARELGLTHANASYHLRVLFKADELVVEGTEKVRGGIAKRYRYPHEREGNRPGVKPTAQEWAAYVGAIGRETERRARSRDFGQGGSASDLEGWVTEEVWEQAKALLHEASMLLHNHNQPAHTPGTVHFAAMHVAFRMSEVER